LVGLFPPEEELEKMVISQEPGFFGARTFEEVWLMKEFSTLLQVVSVWDEQWLGGLRVSEDCQSMVIDLQKDAALVLEVG